MSASQRPWGAAAAFSSPVYEHSPMLAPASSTIQSPGSEGKGGDTSYHRSDAAEGNSGPQVTARLMNAGGGYATRAAGSSDASLGGAPTLIFL